MVAEFLEFLRKTNALALAVAVIIGAAIGKGVSSIVNDLLIFPGVCPPAHGPRRSLR